MKPLFPDPRQTDETGLVCIGRDLQVKTLHEAYWNGIFPWPQPGYPLLWFCPPERGVIDFSELHIPRSLKKCLRLSPFHFTMNQAFDRVIEACARAPRPQQQGTWILPAVVQAYKAFHRAGYAHSVECWENDELVGGLYGVYVGNVLSGESMFFERENASKMCLLHLVDQARARGLKWMDVQMVTPVVGALGGKYISRDVFLQRVQVAHQQVESAW